MRILWILLTLALCAWPVHYHGFSLEAAAAEFGTSTTTSSSATPATSETTQQGTQNNNQANNQQGSQQSSMMGMMAIAAGAAMMAMGMAMMNPGLIMAGAALMMAGMMAMQAASNMDKNANQSGLNGANLGAMPDISGFPTAPSISTATGGPALPGANTSLTGDPSALGANPDGSTALGGPGGGGSPGTTSSTPGSTLGGSQAGTSGIKIDPSLTRTGKADPIFSDFEQKTGLNRDDLVSALNEGKSPADLLAQSAAAKGAGYDATKITEAMNSAAASGNLPSGQEMLDKLGLTPEDLAAMAKANADNAYATGGSGASRTPASNSFSTDFSFTPPGAANATLSPSSMTGLTNSPLGAAAGNLSPSVQSALDRNGLSTKSLFEMVHSQYKRKTPMMMGSQERKASSHADNPFADLAKDQVEL